LLVYLCTVLLRNIFFFLQIYTFVYLILIYNDIYYLFFFILLDLVYLFAFLIVLFGNTAFDLHNINKKHTTRLRMICLRSLARSFSLSLFTLSLTCALASRTLLIVMCTRLRPAIDWRVGRLQASRSATDANAEAATATAQPQRQRRRWLVFHCQTFLCRCPLLFSTCSAWFKVNKITCHSCHSNNNNNEAIFMIFFFV